MFIVCKNCKRVIISWSDNDTVFTRHAQMGMEGFACSLCFGGCKTVSGDPPELCIHGRSKEMRCYECLREDRDFPNY